MRRSLVQAVRRVPWWVWLITAIALVPRLLLVPYGLPYELDPDERYFVDAAWQMVANGDGDPGWYSHPASPFLDVLAALYAAYGLTGVAVGGFDSIAVATDAYLADVTHLHIIGRLLTVISGVAAVLMTYAVARALRVSPSWAATAALLMAVSPAMVRFSAIVRGDMLMIALLLLTVLMSIRVLILPTGRRFVLAGVVVGLTAASKYPGVLGVVPLVVANATLTVEQRVTPRRGLLLLAIAAAAAAVAAFAVGPYLFLHVDQTIAAIRAEAGVTGDTDGDMLTEALRYLTASLPSGVGGPASFLGLAGLVAMLTRRRERIVSATFLPYLAVISFMGAGWARWALPLLPLVAIGATWLLDRAQLRCGSRLSQRWAVFAPLAMTALLLWSPAASTLALLPPHLSGDDARLEANAWVADEILTGSSILVDSYTLQVPADDFDIRIVRYGAIVEWPEVSGKRRPEGYFQRLGEHWFGSPDELIAAIEAAGIEYIALADLWIDIARTQADRNPQVYGRYEALLDHYPTVARFGDSAALGSPVTILAVREPGERAGKPGTTGG